MLTSEIFFFFKQSSAVDYILLKKPKIVVINCAALDLAQSSDWYENPPQKNQQTNKQTHYMNS